MIILSLMIYLPVPVILVTGLIIVCGHNLLDALDYPRPVTPPLRWGFLHQQSFFPFDPNRMFAFLYPLIPWPGVMMLGYTVGTMYQQEYNDLKRRRQLMVFGTGITLFFAALRLINVYGDPSGWQYQKNLVFTVLSFLNVTRYLPSFLFLSMTPVPALIILSLVEPMNAKWTKIVAVYGGVPFFYFLVHSFILHFVCMVIFFLNGHTLARANTGLLHFRPDNFGYSPGIVYLIWLAVVIYYILFVKNIIV